MSVADATAVVAESILDLSRRHRRPISTSAAWALPDDDVRGEWAPRGAAGRGGFDAVIERLHGMNACPSVQAWGKSERGEFRVPTGMSEEDLRWFWTRVQDAGQTGRAGVHTTDDTNHGRKDLE